VTDKNLRAAIYARISQDREGAGLGVDRQIADCQKLAEQLGVEVVSVHRDDDTSAYSGKRRKGYEALLKDLEAGRANVVLAWHGDRLHRSPKELETFIDVCEAHHVTVHTVQGGVVDLSTPTGRMIARTVGTMARFESEHKSARIKRARLQAATDGRWHGGPTPWGFLDDGVTHHPEQAAAIRYATEQILAGAALRSVVKTINERGLRNTKGNLWIPREFREVLMRARNAGIAVYQGKEVGKATWEPIVSEDSWRAVVAVLGDPARRTTTGNRVTWLGSYVYRCGTEGCTSFMICTTSGGGSRGAAKRPASYRCRISRENAIRGHVSRRADYVDALVEEYLLTRLERPDAVDLLTVDDEAAEDTSALHAEANTLRARLDALAVEFADGALTASQLRTATERIRGKLELVEQRIASAAAVSPLVGIVGVPNPREVWNGWDIGRKRAVVKELLEVTILPSPPGRMANGTYFDPAYVRVEPRRRGEA
jgi:DNA invertase Pin-like site-specific DNA recombinase